MAKRKKANHPSQYLNNLEEWNEHQYDPGHYLGGRVPPAFKYSIGGAGSGIHTRKGFGLLLLIAGIISTIGMVLSMLNRAGNIILGIVFTVIMIAAGIKLTFFKS